MKALAIGLCFAWCASAYAQQGILLPPATPNPVVPAVCGGFTGPGDLVGTWDIWVGLRAFTAATCGTKAIQVTKVVSSTTSDINSLSTNGQLDMAAALSFAGTSASCTGTISGTTMTISSCSSGTLHGGDTIAGVGINPPAYIVNINTCGSPPGTCTLNASQTVAVGETITATNQLTITKFYDKSGANLCGGGECDINGGGASAPLLVPNCLNSATLPCAIFAASRGASPVTTDQHAFPNTPYTVSLVGERTQQFTTLQALWGAGGSVNNPQGNFTTSTNTFAITGGSTITATASDGDLHSFQLVYNTTTSTISVDNTVSAPGATGNANIGNCVNCKIELGQNFSGGQVQNGIVQEFGISPSALSTTDQTHVSHNQCSYWATPTSC